VLSKRKETTMTAKKTTKKLQQGKKMGSVKPLSEIVITKYSDRPSPN
jgi:hypothetical protein